MKVGDLVRLSRVPELRAGIVLSIPTKNYVFVLFQGSIHYKSCCRFEDIEVISESR